MSDARLRELERRLLDGGGPEEELAYLRAALHAGRVSEGDVRLAAHLGSPGARTLIGYRAPSPRARRRGLDPVRLVDWCAEIASAGEQAELRALVAQAWFARARVGELACELGATALEAAEGYALAPSQTRRLDLVARLAAIRERHEVLENNLIDDDDDLDLDLDEDADDAQVAVHVEDRRERKLRAEGEVAAARTVALEALGLAAGEELDLAAASPALWLLLARQTWPRFWFDRGTSPAAAEISEVEALVRRAIEADLLPWALGLDDPIRRRREAARPPTYSARERYAVGAALYHPRFGLGVVRRASGPQIEVAFAEHGVRRLAQGR